MRRMFGPEWVAKTEKLNANRTLQIGDQVIDIFQDKGVVVKIMTGEEMAHDGTIFVWQSERMEYGRDNCQHYGIDNWRRVLRVLVPAGSATETSD